MMEARSGEPKMATELPEDRPNLAELSKRLARTHGIPDCEPSKRFCNMLGRLPEPGRQEALRDCGDVLGWRLDPEEVLQGPDPATELLRPPTLEELRKRLQHLLQRERIFEPMLLPALQHYLVESFRVACHPAATSDAIDRDLQHL